MFELLFRTMGKVDELLGGLHRKMLSPKKIACPNCEKELDTKVPKRHECIFCGYRFEIDENCRLYSLDDSNQRIGHIPNKIPRDKRIASLVIALGVLGYLLFELWANQFDVPIPLGKRHAIVLHFTGGAIPLLALSALCLVFSVISVVVDHFDHRPNEESYRYFLFYSILVGVTLFVGGFAVGLLEHSVSAFEVHR